MVNGDGVWANYGNKINLPKQWTEGQYYGQVRGDLENVQVDQSSRPLKHIATNITKNEWTSTIPA